MIYTQIDLTKKRINIPNKIAGKEGESFVRGLEFIIPPEYKDWLISFDVQNAAGEKYKKYPSKTEGNISVYEFSKKDLEARGVLLIEVVLENGDKTYKPFLGEFSVKYAICAEDDSGDIFEDEDEESAELRKEIALNSKSRHDHANKEVIDSLGVNNENTRLTFRDFENSTMVLATIEDVVSQSIALRRELEEQISKIPKLSVEVVEELPTDAIDDSTIYLVRDSDDENNLYTEYIHINGVWECLGSQSIDLTNYYNKQEIDKMGFITEEQLPKTEETDPTVPDWAKQPNKPEYTAEEVGALPTGTTIPSSEDIKTEVEAALIKAKESGDFKGEQGLSGVYVGSGEMPDGYNVQIDPTGEAVVIPTKTSELINDSGFIRKDELPEGSSGLVVDPTLTSKGFAADAKATGDRLSDVEYQTITTDMVYTHKELPKGEKTVTISNDGSWGDDVYAYTGDDLIPRKTFNRTFPWNGITITREDYIYYVTGATSTSSSTVLFSRGGSDVNIPVEHLIGKTLRILSFADQILGSKITASMQFYDSSNNTVQVMVNGKLRNNAPCYVAQSSNSSTVACVVPENASYMRVSLTVAANQEIDCHIQMYVVTDEDVQTIESETPVANINSSEVTNIFTFPYPSTVETKTFIYEYIDYRTNNADGKAITYLTPEAFGAIGDGYSDDTNAINLCLTAAASTGQSIIMARKYNITSPIELKQGGLNVDINDIVYTGADAAIKISSMHNNVRIRSITSSGIGISFRADNNVAVLYNNVDVNSIAAKSHGIVFYNGLKGIYQNTVRFNKIVAGGTFTTTGETYYGICELPAEDDSFVTENNFYGGYIEYCKWAVYGLGGNSKFYNIQVENNIDGGFFITKGGCLIFYPRHTEMMYYNTNNAPIFKLNTTKDVHIYASHAVSLDSFDLSDCEDTFTTEDGHIYPVSEGYMAIIHTPLTTNNYAMGHILTTKAYILGKFIIMHPYMAYRKVVTANLFDTRLVGTQTIDEELSFSRLPTKFVVNTVNSEIYLHSSYCAFGYNEFEVEQANGFACKIYDVLGNLIFDGTELGNGIYKVKVYLDADRAKDFNYGSLRVDFLGHYWEITKQGVSVVDDEAGNITLTTEVVSV